MVLYSAWLCHDSGLNINVPSFVLYVKVEFGEQKMLKSRGMGVSERTRVIKGVFFAGGR